MNDFKDFVLTQFEDVRDEQTRFLDYLKQHMEREEETTRLILDRLARIEANSKWHFTWLSALTSTAAGVASFIAAINWK